MAKLEISTRRLAISKANAQVVAIVAAASFVTVFCLVASNAVFKQYRYQGKVVGEKEKAHQQLESNIKAYDKLAASYKAFDSASINVIGGTKSGTGDNDGRNAKIVLDALPSSYDFPALTSSIEKILASSSLKVTSITGTDDELNQQGNISSATPEPISIPFSFSVSNANYASIQQLITKLQQSIRPLQVDSLDLTGGANDMSLTVSGHTFFQPSKNLNITKKVVK
ncbi:MAG: hypothetical protein AAB971_01655 [Patescibacteria group bacterium]